MTKSARASAGTAPRHFHLLIDLVELEAVFVDQDEQIFLSDTLLGRLLQPFLAYMAADFAVFALEC